MATVLDKTADTTPTPDDILYTINDPAGTPADRKTQVGALTGLTGYGFLNAATLAGATSAPLKGVPATLSAYSAWVVIDPFTIECEVRRVISISTNTVTIAALTYAHAANDTVFILASPTLNLKWFGAKGDGVTNDRIPCNRAADQLPAGGALYAPTGRYRNRPAGTNPQMINLSGKTDILIYGDGWSTVFELDPTYDWASSSPDAHMFLCVGSQRITFRDFQIDGQWDEIEVINPSLNEQMHGFYLGAPAVYGQTAGQTRDIIIENVWMNNMRGDGWFCIGDSSNTTQGVKVLHSKVSDGGRAGGAHQSVIDLWVEHCTFDSNRGQDLDFEITSSRPMRQIRINDNEFNHDSDTACVALTGLDADNRMIDVWFTNNRIPRGGLYVRYVKNAYIINNSIKSAETAGQITALVLSFGLEDVWIVGNKLEGNLPVADAVLKIDPLTTGTNKRVYVLNNSVIQNYSAGSGIFAANVSDTLVVKGNTIVGPGSTTSTCVGIDGGNQIGPSVIYNHEYSGNHISNFRYALKVAGTTTRQIDGVEICDNHLYDNQVTPTQINGIWLDGSNFTVGGRLKIAGNVIGRGITTPLINDASIPYWAIGGNLGHAAEWLIASGSPEGVITDRIGGRCLALDDGDYYKKTSDTGSSGWVLV